ncbi:MAG: hypothetical protein PUP46_10605 [Endozoicomonas sp. (ex Botrylloides leachii)]|nr:hypothetical protein [Endozoicomonas sp. (ex Botrylloides leachii)]
MCCDVLYLNNTAYAPDKGYDAGKKNELHAFAPDKGYDAGKKNELHAFAVIPQRWIIKRTFVCIESC